MRKLLPLSIAMILLCGCPTSPPAENDFAASQPVVEDPCEILIRDFAGASRGTRFITIDTLRNEGVSKLEALAIASAACQESCLSTDCLSACLDCNAEVVEDVYSRAPPPLRPPPGVEEPAPPPPLPPPPSPPNPTPPPRFDFDEDGVEDAVDNCILDPNPNQEDRDGNGLGDVCDIDIPPPGVVEVIIVANDGQFLGVLSDNSFDLDSIANEFGTYGNSFNFLSIWNSFGTYGSDFGMLSPWNSFTSTPPQVLEGGEFLAAR